MAESHELGKRGERIARNYLEDLGWTILEVNWRFSRAEIDLIAREGDVLVFIEVKTRSNIAFGEPEDFVIPKKEELIAKAASVYLEQIGHEWEFRFDIIGITMDSHQHYQLKHLKDAFFPGEW